MRSAVTMGRGVVLIHSVGKSKEAMVEELKKAPNGEVDVMVQAKVLEEGMKIEGTRYVVLR